MVIFILSNLKEETKNSNGHFSFFVARNTLALICFIQTSCRRFSQISPWLVRRDLNMLDIFAMPSKWTSPPFSQLFSGVAGANGCPCKDWLLPHPASHLFNCRLGPPPKAALQCKILRKSRYATAALYSQPSLVTLIGFWKFFILHTLTCSCCLFLFPRTIGAIEVFFFWFFSLVFSIFFVWFFRMVFSFSKNTHHIARLRRP